MGDSLKTNRIQETFTALEKRQEKALITFITAGDPDVSKSVEVLKSLSTAGADLIEIGIPFSDPMADGPTIQASNLRALKNGMTLQNVLEMVVDFRTTNTSTPIILMGYFNPIYKYGSKQFIQDAAQSGVDGLIIVDLPPEEDTQLRKPAQANGISLIRLITPTTSDTRLQTVLEDASGFLYYVSITGVTGTKSANIDQVGQHIAHIKTKTHLPVAVGFGIRTPENAKQMSQIADGIVVGSAIVENMQEQHKKQNSSTTQDDLSTCITKQVRDLKKAIHQNT